LYRKHQIPSSKFQINSNHANSKDILGYLKLGFGAYLGFGICHLKFPDPLGWMVLQGIGFM
jgi:hypothetical protein